MAPRVSVVMPVYNGERYIAESVKSVLASTFRDLELLILDDGSTDASVSVATQAANGDPRLRVVTLPHGGVGQARNAGLQHARADLIANLDADDLMFPERLARQVAFLDANPECVAVGARSVVIDAQEQPIRIVGRFFEHEAIDRALLSGNGGALGNPTAVFRKATALEVGGYGDHLQTTGEDHDLWLRMAEAGRLACLPDVLVWYRIHAANLSAGPGSRERRLPVTLATLARAYARRGIVGREPKKEPTPPITSWEQRCDNALLKYYSGHRVGAAFTVLGAMLAQPGAPTVKSAVRTILGETPPRMAGIA